MQFWKVLLCDDTSWTPGLLEKEGREKGQAFQEFWPKYRNLIVRCVAGARVSKPSAAHLAGWSAARLLARTPGAAAPAPAHDPAARGRWDVLDTALREIVETRGDMALFRERWAEGRWWWLSNGNQTVYAGRSIYQTCKKARKAKVID